jgi:hypothetical protein
MEQSPVYLRKKGIIMAESKYGKYFFEKPIVEGKFAPRLIFFSSKYVGEKNFSLLWNCVTEPFLMAEEPHSHDFDQFLHFYGANSLNITDFDAEVELLVGEEGEKHIITEPTVVHIPRDSFTVHFTLRSSKNL